MGNPSEGLTGAVCITSWWHIIRARIDPRPGRRGIYRRRGSRCLNSNPNRRQTGTIAVYGDDVYRGHDWDSDSNSIREYWDVSGRPCSRWVCSWVSDVTVSSFFAIISWFLHSIL